MMTIRIKVETDQATQWLLQRVKPAIDAAALRSWVDSTTVARKFMQNNGYISRTGRLTESMREGPTVRRGFLQYRSDVSANASYALFVDQPTKAHEIKARRAPFLVFFWGPPKGPGATIFARKVWHPGTRGALFTDMTAKHMVGRFQVSAQVAIDAALRAT